MKLLIALIIVIIATLAVAYKEDGDKGDDLKDVIKSLSNEEKMKIIEDALDEFNENEDDENFEALQKTKQKDPKPWWTKN